MPNWGKGHRVIPFGLYTWMQDTWRHLALSFLTSDSGKTNKLSSTFKLTCKNQNTLNFTDKFYY